MQRYKSGAGGIIPPDPDYEAWEARGLARVWQVADVPSLYYRQIRNQGPWHIRIESSLNYCDFLYQNPWRKDVDNAMDLKIKR